MRARILETLDTPRDTGRVSRSRRWPRRNVYASGLIAVFLAGAVWFLQGYRGQAAAGPPPSAGHPDLTEILDLQRSLLTHPDDAETRVRLGILDLRYGNAVGAEHHLRKALALGADKARVAPMIAKSLLLRQEPQQLLDEVAVDPEFDRTTQALILSLRGQALLALQRFDGARESIRAAMTLDPSPLEVHLGLLRLRLAERAFDEAYAVLAQAVEAHGDTAETAWLAGWLALERGEYASAAERFQKVIDATPEGWQTAWSYGGLLGQAEAWLRDGRLAESQRNVDRLLAIDADDSSANYLAAVAAFRAGTADIARQHLLRVANSSSKHPAALLLLAILENARGNTEHAAGHLARHLAAHADDYVARDLMIALQVRLGDLTQAAKLLVALDPARTERPALLAWRGWFLLLDGDVRAAEAIFDRAAALAPNDAQLARVAQALAVAADINKAGPVASGAEARLFRDGLALVRAGNFTGAIDALEAGMSNDSSGPEAAALLGALQLRGGAPEKARETVAIGLARWSRLVDRYGEPHVNLAGTDAAATTTARFDVSASFFYLVDWRSYVERYELKPIVPATMFDEGRGYGWAEESGLGSPPPVSLERRARVEPDPADDPRKRRGPATVPPLSVVLFMSMLVLQRVVSHGRR